MEHAERDLEEGLAYVRQRLKEDSKGAFSFLARGMEAAVLGGVAALELRPRLREDVRFLLDLATQVNAGADVAALADEHLPRVLRLKDLNLVVKVKEPDFQPALAWCREAFLARLPDLARMAAVPDPVDYDDLLRTAFPDRAVAERIVRENRDLMIRLFDHADQNPHLLRIPTSFVPRVAELARDVTEWKTREVMRGIGEAYGKT